MSDLRPPNLRRVDCCLACAHARTMKGGFVRFTCDAATHDAFIWCPKYSVAWLRSFWTCDSYVGQETHEEQVPKAKDEEKP